MDQLYYTTPLTFLTFFAIWLYYNMSLIEPTFDNNMIFIEPRFNKNHIINKLNAGKSFVIFYDGQEAKPTKPSKPKLLALLFEEKYRKF